MKNLFTFFTSLTILLNAQMLYANDGIVYDFSAIAGEEDIYLNNDEINHCEGSLESPLNSLETLTADAYKYFSLDGNGAGDRVSKLYAKHNCNPDMATRNISTRDSESIFNDAMNSENGFLNEIQTCVDDSKREELLNTKEGCLGVKELQEKINNGEITPASVYADYKSRIETNDEMAMGGAGVLIGTVVINIVAGLITYAITKTGETIVNENKEPTKTEPTKPSTTNVNININIHVDDSPATTPDNTPDTNPGPTEDEQTPETEEDYTPNQPNIDSDGDGVIDDNTDEFYPPKDEEEITNFGDNQELEMREMNQVWDEFLKEVEEKVNSCSEEILDPYVGVRNGIDLYSEEKRCDIDALKADLAQANPMNRSIHTAYQEALMKEYELKEQAQEEKKQEVIAHAPSCGYFIDPALYESCQKKRADYFESHGVVDPEQALFESLGGILVEEEDEIEEYDWSSVLNDTEEDSYNSTSYCDDLKDYPEVYNACIGGN